MLRVTALLRYSLVKAACVTALSRYSPVEAACVTALPRYRPARTLALWRYGPQPQVLITPPGVESSVIKAI